MCWRNNRIWCKDLLYKGGFPLGEMSGDFAAKFIWTSAFWFVYSLAGEMFLFKIVKLDLTNSRGKKSHDCLTNQNANTIQSLLYQEIHFSQIKSKMAANNMSNIHLQMFFQLTKTNSAWHFQKQSSRCYVKKLLLKFTQNSQESICVGVSF